MRRFFIGLMSGAIVAALGLGIVSQVAAPGATAVAADDAGETKPSVTGGVANETAALPEDATIAATGDLVAEAPVPVAIDGATAVDISGAASDAPVPRRTSLSGAASDGADALHSDEAAVADTVNPPHGVSGAGLETPASGVPQTSETAKADEAAQPLATAIPEVDTNAAAIDPVEPAPVAGTDVAAAEEPGILAPALPLIDVPQPQQAAVAAEGAAAPAADSTTDLGLTGPDAPRAPGADRAPPEADLPPPPPPGEQAIAATADAPVAGDAAASPALAQPEIAASDVPAAATPDPQPEAIALAPVTPEPALPEPVPAEPALQEVPDVDAGPSVLQPDTPLIEPELNLPVTPSLGSTGEGVIVNRPSPATAPVAQSPVLPEVTLETLPPVTRYAAAFENPDAKPLFSIVLIDTGEATLDRASIAALPFAISVALDPLSADAAAHAALYRAGGKEVLMLASGIPAGASPSDLEQTFQALGAALPEAVAVVDTEEARFQNDRPLATQIVPILAAQGRGLVTWDRGLNAADQVARREGLASAVIFRSIDGDGEAVPAIRRYLDRAAFKAAQEGQVTVMGRVRPETVAALLEWMIEGRASSVAIAPVSAQLALR
jgi:uncharacterized protein